MHEQNNLVLDKPEYQRSEEVAKKLIENLRHNLHEMANKPLLSVIDIYKNYMLER